MNNIDEAKLLCAFRSSPIPSEADMAKPNDEEAEADISRVLGKAWTELQPCDYKQASDLPFWLNDSCFVYYFPSIIKCSLEEIKTVGRPDKSDLAVGTFLYSLISRTSNNADLFTRPQLELLIEWL